MLRVTLIIEVQSYFNKFIIQGTYIFLDSFDMKETHYAKLRLLCIIAQGQILLVVLNSIYLKSCLVLLEYNLLN